MFSKLLRSHIAWVSVCGICCAVFLLYPLQIGAQSSPETTDDSPKYTVFDGITGFASRVVTLNNPVRLENPPEGFNIEEQPEFTVFIPHRTETEVGKAALNKWEQTDEQIEVTVVHKETGERLPATIQKSAAGTFTVLPQKDNDWKPGVYSLDLEAKETFFYTRDLTQDFSWGVLSLNTKKSIYTPGQTVELSFGILNELGHTLCDAPLTLVITAPDQTRTTLSRANGEITQSGECSGDSVTEKPDYMASYPVEQTGLYQLELTGTNENGDHTILDVFEVRESVPFDIERTSFPTRVYPISPYEVELAVRANEDYQGTVQDFVPKVFYIDQISDGGTTQNEPLKQASVSADVLAIDEEAYKNIPEKSKLMYDVSLQNPTSLDKTPTAISWNVNWKKGQTYTLRYRIHFPVVSPEFFLIGPFTIGEFAEFRQWQVANDAARTWDGGGATNNWNDNVNWSSDLTPGSGDTATFNTTSLKNADINVSITIQSLTIATGYTGTITQQGTNTITMSGNTTGFVVQDGTFVGGVPVTSA